MSSADPMKFQERGFRFVIRDGEASWRKPADVRENDFDATNLSEEEVAEVFVARRTERHAK